MAGVLWRIAVAITLACVTGYKALFAGGVILLLLNCFYTMGQAPVSMQVTLNKQQLEAGDTLSFVCRVPAWLNTRRGATLNVWIEDAGHTRRWKLRYPVIAGESAGDIVLPDSMPRGAYGLRFSLQTDIYSMYGRLLNKARRQDSIRCIALFENGDLYMRNLPMDALGNFEFRHWIFGGKSTVFFSPLKSATNNNLDIQLTVPLDSAFRSLADTVLVVRIGQEKEQQHYQFDAALFENRDTGTLQQVTIVGKRKTPAEQFQDDYVTGMFKSDNGYVFDGLESPRFIGWQNALDWLQGRVPGISVRRTGVGDYEVTWRMAQTALFLDEIPVDANVLATIPANDVAIIKVFRPPFMGAAFGGGGGAIALYTKRGSYQTDDARHRFVIQGYTPALYVLPYRH